MMRKKRKSNLSVSANNFKLTFAKKAKYVRHFHEWGIRKNRAEDVRSSRIWIFSKFGHCFQLALRGGKFGYYPFEAEWDCELVFWAMLRLRKSVVLVILVKII
jgi:hypothetical protein